MKVTIRPAHADDTGNIVALIHKLAAYEQMQSSCRADPKKLLKDIYGHDPRIYCLLAETENGEPIGFTIYYFGGYSSFQNNWQLYLEDVFVLEECRGLGVAKKIFGALARASEKKNCREIAFSVLDWNQAAIDAYKKLGAVETELRITKEHTWIGMSISGASLDALTTVT